MGCLQLSNCVPEKQFCFALHISLKILSYTPAVEMTVVKKVNPLVEFLLVAETHKGCSFIWDNIMLFLGSVLRNVQILSLQNIFLI